MPKGTKKQSAGGLGFTPMLQVMFNAGGQKFDSEGFFARHSRALMKLAVASARAKTLTYQMVVDHFPDLAKLEGLEGTVEALNLGLFIQEHAEEWGTEIVYGAGKPKGGRPPKASKKDSTTGGPTKGGKRGPGRPKGSGNGRRKKSADSASPESSRREGSTASKVINAVGGKGVAKKRLQALYDKCGTVPLLAEFFRKKKGIDIQNANMAFILKGLKVKTSRSKRG